MLPILASCLADGSSDDSPVIASVGGEQLTLAQALNNIPEIALEQDTLQALESYKEQWISEKVSVSEARRLGLQNDREFQEKLARAEEQLLADMLQEFILAENEEELTISRDEAQNYFQENRDKFILNERYIRFRHVTASTRSDIDNARSELMRGVDWETVLERYSVDPELQLRQSTQFLPITLALSDIPMLNRYLTMIGISEVSPVHFENGRYHFVQLREIRNEGDHPDFDWLIPRIQEWLKLEKSKRITNAFKRNLYLQAESNDEISRMDEDEMETAVFNFLSN